MPLKTGYSRATLSHNIAEMVKAGHPRNVAIQVSMNLARKCYFAHFPKGRLPHDLAFPKNALTKNDYDKSGAPVKANPVDELEIAPEEMAELRKATQKNYSGKGAAVKQAAVLYADFTGHDPELTKVKVPNYPKAALAVGEVDGILYTTVRDGVVEHYIHDFKKHARPLLAASSDGRQLLMLGGAFTFTERGIVDDPKGKR